MIPLVDLTRQHAALRPALLAAVARVLDSSQFCFAELSDAEVDEVAQATRLACGRL